MPTVPTHPTDETLDDFLLGRLSDAEHALVDEHLTQCVECEARAAGRSPSDPLISLLISAGVPESTTVAAGVALMDTSRLHETDLPSGDNSIPDAKRHSSPVLSDAVPPGLDSHPRYRIIRQLGRGGMGTVWLAEHLVMGRMVALKAIQPALLRKPGAMERFRREVHAAARLVHPNIAIGYDADRAGETQFLVMEYIAGPSLAERVQSGPLSVVDACRAVRDAALGLECAHAAGLVHRDVKPSNLIQTPDGLVKVLDFGLVNATDDELELTEIHVLMGTLDYISPEQARDAAAADARSDIYSLGCTLYHLLSGKPPFGGKNLANKIAMHLTDDPPPIPVVPEPLMTVINRMMAKRPSARFASAADVAQALTSFCGHGPPASAITSGRSLTAWPFRTATIALGVVLLAAIVYSLASGKPQKVPKQRVEHAPGTTAPPSPEKPLVIVKDHQVLKGHEKLVFNLTWSHDGETLFSASEDGTCRMWEVARKRELHRFEHGRDAKILAVMLTDDDLTMISCIGSQLLVWDVTSGEQLKPFPKVSPANELSDAKISPNGKLIATGGVSGKVRVWDIASRKIIQDNWQPSVGRECYSVCWVDDDLLLAAGMYSIGLKNIKTDKIIHHSRLRGNWVRVDVAPDHKTYSGVRYGGGVAIFDLKTGEVLNEFLTRTHNGTGPVRQLYTLDGYLAVAPVHHWIDVCNPRTGKRVATFEEHAGEPYAMAVSPNGEWLATGGTDAAIRIWRLPDLGAP